MIQRVSQLSILARTFRVHCVSLSTSLQDDMAISITPASTANTTMDHFYVLLFLMKV